MSILFENAQEEEKKTRKVFFFHTAVVKHDQTRLEKYYIRYKYGLKEDKSNPSWDSNTALHTTEERKLENKEDPSSKPKK